MPQNKTVAIQKEYGEESKRYQEIMQSITQGSGSLLNTIQIAQVTARMFFLDNAIPGVELHNSDEQSEFLDETIRQIAIYDPIQSARFRELHEANLATLQEQNEQLGNWREAIEISRSKDGEELRQTKRSNSSTEGLGEDDDLQGRLDELKAGLADDHQTSAVSKSADNDDSRSVNYAVTDPEEATRESGSPMSQQIRNAAMDVLKKLVSYNLTRYRTGQASRDSEAEKLDLRIQSLNAKIDQLQAEIQNIETDHLSGQSTPRNSNEYANNLEQLSGMRRTLSETKWEKSRLSMKKGGSLVGHFIFGIAEAVSKILVGLFVGALASVSIPPAFIAVAVIAFASNLIRAVFQCLPDALIKVKESYDGEKKNIEDKHDHRYENGAKIMNFLKSAFMLLFLQIGVSFGKTAIGDTIDHIKALAQDTASALKDKNPKVVTSGLGNMLKEDWARTKDAWVNGAGIFKAKSNKESTHCDIHDANDDDPQCMLY